MTATETRSDVYKNVIQYFPLLTLKEIKTLLHAYKSKDLVFWHGDTPYTRVLQAIPFLTKGDFDAMIKALEAKQQTLEDWGVQ